MQPTQEATDSLWRKLEALTQGGHFEVVARCVRKLTDDQQDLTSAAANIRKRAIVLLGTAAYRQQMTGLVFDRANTPDLIEKGRSLFHSARDVLKSAALPPTVISYVHSLIDTFEQTTGNGAPSGQMRLFLSYRRDDSADVTGRIHDKLAAHFGASSLFMDVYDIPLGVDFRSHIVGIQSRCQAHLVIIGPRWMQITNPAGQTRLQLERDQLRIEIETALNLKNAPVVPVLVSGAEMPRFEDLPPSIADLAFRESQKVRPDPDFDGDIQRLIARLKNQLR